MTKGNSQPSMEASSHRIYKFLKLRIGLTDQFLAKHSKKLHRIYILKYLDQVCSTQPLCTEKRIFEVSVLQKYTSI